MNDNVLNLIKKYANRGVLPDTNLLLLYFIGSVDRDRIGRFKPTSGYSISDFHLISKFIEHFEVRVTTPHILTEMSNHLESGLIRDLKKEYFEAFAKSITFLSEKFHSSLDLSETKPFHEYGVADAAIAMTAKDNFLVLTVDRPLYGYLRNTGIDAVTLAELKAF